MADAPAATAATAARMTGAKMTDFPDLDAPAGAVFSSGWHQAADTLKVTEPATGAVLATVGLANAADIARAVAGAKRAQPDWGAAPPQDRAALLRRAAAVLETKRSEVTAWLVREGGATGAKADIEIGLALDELWAAAALPMQPQGHLLPSVPGRMSVARRLPVGVVGVISPWNFPLLLSLRAVAPALALGNSVVLKPDMHTAVSGGLVIARLFEEAGLPEGVLHALAGDADAGRALTADPDIAMIAFTGSTAAGREVGAAAGGALKPCSLELGGNNALIVLDDADLDLAAAAGAFGAFFHQGQVCMAAGRHIVLEAVAERYMQRLVARAERLTVGDPWTSRVDLGPLIGRGHLDRVHQIVTGTLAAGAVLRCGGTHEGLFYRPTVLAGVTATMPAFTEEIFGPVAPVITVRDEDEAVAVANDTQYGLTAAVQTGSAERGLRLADHLNTGIVHVNDQTINDEAAAPFGGRGASGNGARHGAQQSWDQYTQWQWVTGRRVSGLFSF
jgi:benzaldehyde dehydrogenase (NAD)